MGEKGIRKWARTLKIGITLAAGVWLVVAATMLVIAAGSEDYNLGLAKIIYLVLTVLASPVCFIAYGIDRRRAAREQPRLSWRVLHVSALLGGWPGALLGRHVFRREGETLGFRLMLWLIVVLHLAVIFYPLYSPLFATDAQ